MSYGGEYYLANFNNCVNTWGQNVIESSKEAAWLSPMGEVFRFFAQRDDEYPLVTKMETNMKPKGGSRPERVQNVAASEVNFPLIVNRRSKNELVKLSACETSEGLNVYLVNKSTEPLKFNLSVPKGYKAVRIEDMSAPDRLSRAYADHSDITFSTRELKRASGIDVKPLSVNRVVFVKK